jgi:enoyl-CoA hydratase/carnithine racemase
MPVGRIHVDFAEAVAHIKMDRPDKKNAVNLSMMRALGSALREAETRRCLAVVVGCVGEDFSIGRDHYESPLADPPGSTNEEWVGSAGEAFEALNAFTGISLAAARGITFGFGCAFATAADMCIASTTSRFAYDEVPKGFAPKLVMGGLTGRVPPRALLDLVVTGRSIDALAGLRLGIATQVVEAHAHEAVINDLVETLLRHDENAVRESKRFIKALAGMDNSERSKFSVTARALT